jgi:hypothetical protein
MVFDAGGIATTAETSYARYQDVRKVVSQGLRIGPFRYALFVGGQAYGTGAANPMRDSAIIGDATPIWGRGDVFVNGNVRIYRNNYGTVYVPQTRSIFLNGTPTVKTDTLANAVTASIMPVVDTTFYHYYIRNRNSYGSQGDMARGVTYDLNSYPDCVYYCNGDLRIRRRVTVINTNPNHVLGIIVANGDIRFDDNHAANNGTTIADGILILARDSIKFLDNDVDVRIGTTTIGHSGNILYSWQGSVSITSTMGQVVNGTIIANNNSTTTDGFRIYSTGGTTTDSVFGVIFVRQRAFMGIGSVVGSMVMNYSTGSYLTTTAFEPKYLPYPLQGYYCRRKLRPAQADFPFTETEFGLPESLFTVRKIPHTWSYK